MKGNWREIENIESLGRTMKVMAFFIETVRTFPQLDLYALSVSGCKRVEQEVEVRVREANF